ncbi:MAG: hypothetical protein PVF97_01655 [Desulfobacterales bacterium]|jgi:hypothetical protein
MVSFYSLIIFFFILVVLYSAITLALSFGGWLQKRWIGRSQATDPGRLAAVDDRTDRLKALAFKVTVPLVLFCLTPFVLIFFFFS